MTKIFSRKKEGSKQPRKQRKALYNMALHTKGKLMSVHLSPELRAKYSTRNVRVRKGDKVKIVSGQYKGKSGRVEQIYLKDLKLSVNGIETIKKDGSKSFYKFHPSNLMITELDLSDKKRFKKSSVKKSLSEKPLTKKEEKSEKLEQPNKVEKNVKTEQKEDNLEKNTKLESKDKESKNSKEAKK